MSRGPSNPLHGGGWRSYEETPAPPPQPTKPKPGRGRNIRVRVENPGKERREKAMQKLMTTTEKLTPEERQIVRGYRLSTGGDAARRERMRIEAEIAEEGK